MGETPVTRLRVDSNMTTEEMARTISRLLNNIVLGLNRIPNEALKTCGPLIAPWFADIARAYFTIGYYLRLRKAIITIVSTAPPSAKHGRRRRNASFPLERRKSRREGADL